MKTVVDTMFLKEYIFSTSIEISFKILFSTEIVFPKWSEISRRKSLAHECKIGSQVGKEFGSNFGTAN